MTLISSAAKLTSSILAPSPVPVVTIMLASRQSTGLETVAMMNAAKMPQKTGSNPTRRLMTPQIWRMKKRSAKNSETTKSGCGRDSL